MYQVSTATTSIENEKTINETTIEKVPKIFDEVEEMDVMEKEDLEKVEALVRLEKKSSGLAEKSL